MHFDQVKDLTDVAFEGNEHRALLALCQRVVAHESLDDVS
jgi:hypothetical protein